MDLGSDPTLGISKCGPWRSFFWFWMRRKVYTMLEAPSQAKGYVVVSVKWEYRRA